MKIQKIKASLRPLALAAIAALGLVSILGKNGPNNGGTGCPDLLLDFLRQPSGALAFVLGAGNDSGHGWGFVNRSGGESFMNTEFVPNGGFTVPPDSHGLAFDMFVRDHNQIGFEQSTSNTVAFVLEYELPEVACDATFTWETDISITLPNGICMTDDTWSVNCVTGQSERAIFQLITVEDPVGVMAVSGAGRPILEAAIRNALSTAPDSRNSIRLSDTVTSEQRQSMGVSGEFVVAGGNRAHVYVGVSAQLMAFDPGQICTQNCVSSPNDNLVDNAVFLVEGGTDGVVGIGATRVQ